MKMVLFDLGQTLEDADILLPGALETLHGIAELRDGDGPAALLCLISDFTMPANPSEIPSIRQEYYTLLDHLGIREFFEPVTQRVTLSTEVGVRKPAPAIFHAAVTRAGHGFSFDDVLFVTENRGHVLAARSLGLRAVHFRGPGQNNGDIDRLVDLLPLVRDFTGASEALHEEPVDRVAIVHASAPRSTETMEKTALPGAGWVQLGDEILVCGSREDVAHAAKEATPGTTVRIRDAVAPQRLHLVTQNGRLFQQEHPDVPVLVDKGRYLVVECDPIEAQQMETGHLPCFSIRPVPLNTTVFETRTPSATPRAPEDWVQRCVDAVSRTAFENDLRTLTSFPTRHSTSTEFAEAARWARDRLAGLGYTTGTQTVPVDGTASRNVIAERPGSGAAPRGTVLVTAHLDSVNIAGGATAAAPGADDNGSGSAGLLTIARALENHVPQHDLRLILFGGEEQGLLGSLAYVAGLSAAERDRIRGVVNMDMIASLNTPPPTVLLEGAAHSQSLIDDLAQAAATYTTLAVQTSLHPFNSDHVPFIEKGVPAVLTIEGADSANTNIHSAQDTLDFIDYDLAVEILRMNVAVAARLLGEG